MRTSLQAARGLGGERLDIPLDAFQVSPHYFASPLLIGWVYYSGFFSRKKEAQKGKHRLLSFLPLPVKKQSVRILIFPRRHSVKMCQKRRRMVLIQKYVQLNFMLNKVETMFIVQ